MENREIKIIFMGTGRFGAIILDKLAATKYKPILVISEPDKPSGRKQKLKSPECKIIAQKHNIPVEQPKQIQNSKFKIQNSQPNLIVVAAYGKILPKDILDIPEKGCLNIHPSLLPKYRGPSPIQTAILNRDKETGVTIILMDKLVDHGDIISNIKIQMSKQFQNPNYQMLETELALKGANLLLKIIPDWIAGKIKAIPQNEADATYTKIIKKEDGKIDWGKSAKEIEAKIRAFQVWPGTYTFWNDKRIKILKAEVRELPNEKKYDIGKIINSSSGKILVKCGEDSLVIKELQLEGKKPMPVEEFLRGYPDFIEAKLK